MEKIITGIAIVYDSVGKKIVYTYSTVEEDGNIKDVQGKESYLPRDQQTLDILTNLESEIYKRLEGKDIVTQ